MDVTGTFDDPQVALDRDELKAAAKKGAKGALREEVGDRLRRRRAERRGSGG